jgi:hypothetical protein
MKAKISVASFVVLTLLAACGAPKKGSKANKNGREIANQVIESVGVVDSTLQFSEQAAIIDDHISNKEKFVGNIIDNNGHRQGELKFEFHSVYEHLIRSTTKWVQLNYPNGYKVETITSRASSSVITINHNMYNVKVHQDPNCLNIYGNYNALFERGVVCKAQ